MVDSRIDLRAYLMHPLKRQVTADSLSVDKLSLDGILHGELEKSERGGELRISIYFLLLGLSEYLKCYYDYCIH